MPTLKANHRQILATKPIDGKKTRYRIEGAPGLWLSVSPTGVRTWYARYQIGSGKTRQERWFRIGDAKSVELSKAIERAKSIDAEVDVEDRDPHAERTLRRADTMTAGYCSAIDTRRQSERESGPDCGARANLQLPACRVAIPV